MRDLVTGDFGVGILSMPWEELRVHQDWMSLRRVWFGVRITLLVTSLMDDVRGCLVTGQVSFFAAKSHFSMLSRS